MKNKPISKINARHRISKQESISNAASEALQTNREENKDSSVIIGATDIEPEKQPLNAKQEDSENKEVIAPGEAERRRILKQIRERFGNDGIDFGVGMEHSEIKTTTLSDKQEELNQQVIKLQTNLAAQSKPEYPKMDIDNYKILKEHERFWTPYKLHGVLYGLNHRELEILGGVMKAVFDPNYNFDWWCSSCIGQFIKDLYGYFEKWQAKQAEETQEYETILKADKF